MVNSPRHIRKTIGDNWWPIVQCPYLITQATSDKTIKISLEGLRLEGNVAWFWEISLST